MVRKGRPSKIALILNISLKELEQIVYFNSYVVLDPGPRSDLAYKQLLVETDWQVFDATNQTSQKSKLGLVQKQSKLCNRILIWMKNLATFAH